MCAANGQRETSEGQLGGGSLLRSLLAHGELARLKQTETTRTGKVAVARGYDGVVVRAEAACGG